VCGRRRRGAARWCSGRLGVRASTRRDGEHLGETDWRLRLGNGGAAEHAVEVARECGALEVDVDGLGLAGGEAEHSPRQAQVGRPVGYSGRFDGPSGGARAPGRATQDGVPDRDPWANLGERREGAHGGANRPARERATGALPAPYRSDALCPMPSGPASACAASTIAPAAFGTRREPPDADRHFRWSGRGRGKPGPYPIRISNRRDRGHRPAATAVSPGIPVRSPATSMSTSKSVCSTRSKESPADA
jgi:hypothetical protein